METLVWFSVFINKFTERPNDILIKFEGIRAGRVSSYLSKKNLTGINDS